MPLHTYINTYTTNHSHFPTIDKQHLSYIFTWNFPMGVPGKLSGCERVVIKRKIVEWIMLSVCCADRENTIWINMAVVAESRRPMKMSPFLWVTLMAFPADVNSNYLIDLVPYSLSPVCTCSLSVRLNSVINCRLGIFGWSHRVTSEESTEIFIHKVTSWHIIFK